MLRLGGTALAAAGAARLRIGSGGEDGSPSTVTPTTPTTTSPLRTRQMSYGTEGTTRTDATAPGIRVVASIHDRETMRQQGNDFAANCAVFEDDIIGRGAFGIVCKGQDSTTGRILAIKNMTAPSRDVLKETEREYELLVRLSHPNVVETLAFHYDEAAGQASIYMEFVAGGSLCGVIAKYSGDRVKGLPEILIRRYTCDILRGLGAAHGQDIIHRDIKPANMLIGTCGTLKLADFGLCKEVSEHTSVNNPNGVVGTVRYMSPGSIQRRYTVASDIWAVGCTLVEMVSGLPPYYQRSEDAMQMLFAIGQGRLRPEVPTTSNGQPVTSDLLSFGERCFQEPNNEDKKRYPSSTLCEELMAHSFCSQPATLPQPQNPNQESRIRYNDPRSTFSASCLGASSTAPPPSDPGMESGSFALINHSDGPGIDVMPPSSSFVNTATVAAGSHLARESSGIEDDETLAYITSLAQMPNGQIPLVENPENVLHDLIAQGCDEQVCAESEEIRACMLFVSLRYLAVLFLSPEPGGTPYYKSAAVQETVKLCLPILSAARVRQRESAPASFLCFLGALYSGLELLDKTDQMTELVQRQTLASAAFLDPHSTDDMRQKAMRNYDFLLEPRASLFTRIFLLLVPQPVPSLESVISLSTVLGKVLRNSMIERSPVQEGLPWTASTFIESEQWKMMWAAVEHFTQCALHSADAGIHQFLFGNEEGDNVLETLLLDGSVTNLRVRVKVIEMVLVMLHARTRTPVPPEAKEFLTNFMLAVAVHQSMDPRVARPLSVGDVLPSFLQQRPVYDWIPTEYGPATDYVQEAKTNAARTDFLELMSRRRGGVLKSSNSSGEGSFRQASVTTVGADMSHSRGMDGLVDVVVKAATAELAAKSKQYKYDIIFQDDDHIAWTLFFARIAHTHPYNQQPHFYNTYRHLFALVRYLMQCEGDEPDLHAPREHVRYEEDWKPFQTYFPMERMFDDISYLNDGCYLYLGGYTKLLDRVLKGRPRGSFLVRPSKREPGRLVLTAMVKGQRHSDVKLTHKIIYPDQKAQHLVVHQFPVSYNATDRTLLGVRDLLEWLRQIAPDDFQFGAGTRVAPEDEGDYTNDAYCDEVDYCDESDGVCTPGP